MEETEISKKSEQLVQLLQTHLGTRGKTLESAVRRAGRRLPKPLRVKAQVIIEAQRMAQHPKLMRRIDPEAVAAAYSALEAHLTQIDLAERRKTKALNVVAGLVLNLLLLGIAVLVFLRWQGLV